MNLERILSEVEREQKRVWLKNTTQEAFDDKFFFFKNNKSLIKDLIDETIIEDFLKVIENYTPEIIPEIINNEINRYRYRVGEPAVVDRLEFIEKYFPKKIPRLIGKILNNKGFYKNDIEVQKSMIKQLSIIEKRTPKKIPIVLEEAIYTVTQNKIGKPTLDLLHELIKKSEIIKKHMPEKLEQIFQEGLNTRILEIREEVIKQLEIYNSYSSEKTSNLILNILNTEEINFGMINATINQLEIMEKFAPDKISDIIYKGINTSNPQLRNSAINQFKKKIRNNKEKIPEMIEILNQCDGYIHSEVCEKLSFEELIEIGGEISSQKFEKIIAERLYYMEGHNIIDSLKIMEKFAPDKIISKINEILKSEDISIKYKLIGEINFLEKYAPKMIPKLIKKIITQNEINPLIIEKIEILEKYIPENISDLIQAVIDNINEGGYSDSIKSIARGLIIEKLDYIKKYNPIGLQKTIDKELYLIYTDYNFSSYRNRIFKNFPKRLMNEISKGLNHDEYKIKFSSFLMLEKMRLNNTINPGESLFLKRYLKTKYVEEKNDEDIVSELKQFVQTPSKNYELMTQILKRGKAKDLDDIIECSEFESENELFLTRLSKQGKVGTTYLVYNKKIDKERIFKVVKNSLESKIENKNISKFSHQDIVRVSTTGKITREGEIVEGVLMDYIEGEDLAEVMDENPHGLEERLAIRYSTQLLETIIYMISEDFEHRDLHLDNVRIAKKGNRLKIIDFGTSRKINEENTYDERINRAYGGSNDLFSWSLLTYKMITGSHLLSDGKEYGTYDDYKNRILEEKRELREEDGTIKEVYRKRIEENLSGYEGLQNPIIMALENKDELSPCGLVEIIEQEVRCFQDQRVVSQLEKEFGEMNERELAMYQRYKEINGGEA